jgi:spore germination protein KC
MRKNKSTRFNCLYSVILLLILTLSLTGCWSAHEIDELAIVDVIGVDENEAGELEVTASVVKSDNLFARTSVGGIGEGEKQSRSLIETATGKSIYEAMGKLSSSLSERIYLGHLTVIIFGEQAARERMEASLDFFRRENDFRPNIQLYVTKGTASDIIRTSPELKPTLGLEIEQLSERTRYSSSKMMQDLSQFMESLSSNTTDPITAVISSGKDRGINAEGEKSINKKETRKDEQGIKMNSSTEDERNISTVLSLDGTAVFKGGQLKGWLDDQETRGLLWIRGEIENSIAVLSCGKKDDETVSVNVRDSQSQIVPKLSNDGTKMTVNIKVDADIGEITCPEYNVDTASIEQLNQQFEELIREEVTTVLNKAQKEWQADIFGFGKMIYRKYPKEWDQMASQWREGGLKQANVDIKVTANISRFGLNKDPSRSNESR